MSLNPAGTNHSWNYSKPDKEGYSDQLVGTVIFLQEIQKRTYNPNSGQPGQPEFWPDGNPKLNIRMGVATPTGELKTIVFQPAGAKQRSGEKPSLHMDLFALTGNTSMENLIGKTIQITTWPANPTTGAVWGFGNPRLFSVQLVEAGPYQLANPLPSEYEVPVLLANNAASGGQVVQPQPQNPANIYTPQPQQMPQQFMPQTVQPMQNASAYQMTQNPVVTKVPSESYQQPAGQVQAMQPSIPAGMDPQVAQQMQAMGATNVQPYDDENIPF